VLEEGAVDVGDHGLDLLLPAVRVGLWDLDGGGEAIDHEVEQLLLAGHMRVQRRGTGAERVGHAAHVEAVVAVLVEDDEGRLDDRVAR
jgi:hypothetical protein